MMPRASDPFLGHFKSLPKKAEIKITKAKNQIGKKKRILSKIDGFIFKLLIKFHREIMLEFRTELKSNFKFTY